MNIGANSGEISVKTFEVHVNVLIIKFIEGLLKIFNHTGLFTILIKSIVSDYSIILTT